jgi:flagellar basal body-associated protein FliL
MDASARKKIIIALVIFIVLVIGVIIMAVIKNTTSPSSSKNSPKTTTYTDSYSGETVISTEGKVDERYKAEGSSITFLGASKLLEYGVPATHI